MPQSSHREQRPRSARTYVAVVVYLLCFTVLLIVISKMYLLPAMEASRNATPQEKRQLAAFARLMLAVVLFVLFAGLKKTEYVDAWAESGRRMQTPPKPE